MTPMRLEPAAPRSQVKHYTTELPWSIGMDRDINELCKKGHLYTGILEK